MPPGSELIVLRPESALARPDILSRTVSGANWVEEDECSVSSDARSHSFMGFSSMMLLDELADECEVKQVKSSSLTLTDLT